jgi:hypothetical protein
VERLSGHDEAGSVPQGLEPRRPRAKGTRTDEKESGLPVEGNNKTKTKQKKKKRNRIAESKG